MPNFFTHYLCGHKALKLLENEQITTDIKNHINVFNLGTQGPDILFYHNIWPWLKSKGVAAVGEEMHHKKVAGMFSAMLEYTNRSIDGHEALLTSYLLGFLSHYALDCAAHPYVFYRTGFVREGDTSADKYTYYHRSFETAIDELMLLQELMLAPYDLKAHKLINLHKVAQKNIADMYCYTLNKVYDINLEASEIITAIKDMRRAFAVLRDTSGIKKRLLAFAENRIAAPGSFTSTIYEKEARKDLDYLNLKHQPWRLPWDASQESTRSFPELFDIAVRETLRLWNTAFSYFNCEAPLDEVLQIIGNRSFSTGLDCDCDLDFKFFDCVYEK